MHTRKRDTLSDKLWNYAFNVIMALVVLAGCLFVGRMFVEVSLPAMGYK